MRFVTFPSRDIGGGRTCLRPGLCYTPQCQATLICLEAKGFVSLINRQGIMQKASRQLVHWGGGCRGMTRAAPADLTTAAMLEHGYCLSFSGANRSNWTTMAAEVSKLITGSALPGPSHFSASGGQMFLGECKEWAAELMINAEFMSCSNDSLGCAFVFPPVCSLYL